jgi:DNA-binding MarR family transcriptional regulator
VYVVIDPGIFDNMLSISSARWRVMQRISAGEKSVADMARSTGYSRQAVQRLADALVAEGSARYYADESDRRRQCLELMAHIPAAELMATAKTLEHIRLILLADCDYMKRKRAAGSRAGGPGVVAGQLGGT